MPRQLPYVSDHAVLRYLERAHGVPVEEIRVLLATSAAVGVTHNAPAVCLEKVKLVKLVLSNFTLEDGTLRFTYQKPFDEVIELVGLPIWWRRFLFCNYAKLRPIFDYCRHRSSVIGIQ